jgi:ketosteroid isomerase-like protein
MTIKKSVFMRSLMMLCILLAGLAAKAQDVAKELTDAMNNSAQEWNKGHLDTFVSLYDASATMMFPTGPVGMDGIKNLYQKSYFKADGLPKQNLKYTDIKVRMLGKDYALMTGGFTLYGNNLPERSGRYSLVWKHTANGWKILHDHSS